MAISFGRMSRARADALTMKSAIKGPLPLLFAVRRYPASSPMIGTKAAGRQAQLGGFSHQRFGGRGRYSTKHGQFRASRIFGARGIDNAKPSPLVWSLVVVK